MFALVGGRNCLCYRGPTLALESMDASQYFDWDGLLREAHITKSHTTSVNKYCSIDI